MQLVVLSANSVSFLWDRSTSPDVVGYKVYYGKTSGNYSTNVNVGNVISTKINGLVTGTTYYFAVKAYTASGLESDLSNEVSYTVPVPVANALPGLGSRLLILTNGTGSLKATVSRYGTPTNNAVLKFGTNYLITTMCPSNHVFSNWVTVVAGVTNFGGTAPTFNFTFQSNLMLVVTFTTNRFYAAAGKYNGLFSEAGGVTHASAGFAYIKVTAQKAKPGTFSGKLLLAGESLPVTGTFDAAGNSLNTSIVSKVNPAMTYTLRLHLPFDGSGTLTGDVSDNSGLWFSKLKAQRASKSTAYAGQYTMILPGDSDPAVAPGGEGYGLVTVRTTGSISLAGALGDGTAISQSVPVSELGNWPLYATAYRTNKNNIAVTAGLLMGWMSLTNGLDGSLQVIKQSMPGTTYRNGFTNGFTPLTSPYTNSALSGNRVITLTQGSNGVVVLVGGNLPMNVTNKINLSTLNVLTAPPTNTAGQTNKLTLTVYSNTGKLSGSFKPDGITSQKIAGAVLQTDNAAGGYFLSPTESGVFRLLPE